MTKKPFLILQSRPEEDAALDEYESILSICSIDESLLARRSIDKDLLHELPNLNDYSGIILGGGPSNVSDKHNKKSIEQKQYEPQLYKLINNIVGLDFPLLGICYGIGLLATYFNKSAVTKNVSEPVGATKIIISKKAGSDGLLKNVPLEFNGFVGHKEGVEHVHPSIKILAYSSTCKVQMIKIKENIYATQFHPELDHDSLAKRINIYKNHGYFQPEESERLIAKSKLHQVKYPQEILRNFIDIYREDSVYRI